MDRNPSFSSVASPVVCIFSRIHKDQLHLSPVSYVKVVGYAPVDLDLSVVAEYLMKEAGLNREDWITVLSSRPSVVSDAVKAGIL
jgi:hypothetical protein